MMGGPWHCNSISHMKALFFPVSLFEVCCCISILHGNDWLPQPLTSETLVYLSLVKGNGLGSRGLERGRPNP